MDSLTASDPRTVGEFRMLARLGAGGMGQVFLASSLAGRMVAVKVIHPEHCRDTEFVRRFRSEAEAAQKVSGWYTAPVVAAGVNDTPPWLATAFVPGPSLDDLVTKHGPLPVAAVWRLAAGLAEALRAIHGTGLVHRDLKPANVLLALDGPRVIDFGISRAVTDTRLTASGAIIGTPSFMSPEQVQGLVAGPASDVFSMGSVIAFAAAAANPFSSGPGGSAASLMYRIAHAEPDLAGVPVDVRGLIEACLAKDPRQRPDLGRVAAHSTAAAERLGVSPAVFWPREVAAVIQAQQAAVTAQIEAIQGAPATHVEGAWRGPAMGTGPSRRMPSPPTDPSASGAGHFTDSPGAVPAVASGVVPAAAGSSGMMGRPGTAGGLSSGTSGGWPAVPGQSGAMRGPTRRGLLVGAGVGGIAVLGGAIGWALSSRSTASAPPAYTPATGQGLGTGQALPTGSGLQQYYGAGTRRPAAWKFPTGNAVEASPGAGGGAVYVGSTDNNLYAVSIATRQRAWSYQVGSVTVAPEVVGGAVCLATAEGHFYALRAANGTRLWDVDTSLPASYKRTWASDGGTVILGQSSEPPQAYDAATGAKGVSFSTRESYVLGLSAAGGVLYALDALGILYAFHAAAGTEMWRRQLLSTEDPPGTGLAVDGSTIYVGTVSGTLYAVDAATGQDRWTYHPGSGMVASLAVAQGVVYLKDNNGNLHAVGAAGKLLWKRAGGTGVYGVTVAGGRVYYTTVLAVQALDAKSGTPVWAFSVSAETEFLSTPAVANGLVFVGSQDDNLYAIQA